MVWGTPDTRQVLQPSFSALALIFLEKDKIYSYAAIPLPSYDRTSSGQPVKDSQSRRDRHLFSRSIPDEHRSAQPRGPFSRLSPYNQEAIRF